MRILGRHQRITQYRRHWSIEDRLDIIRRLGGKCYICGEVKNLEIHHKVPLREGGNDNIKNCVLLCHKHHLGRRKYD